MTRAQLIAWALRKDWEQQRTPNPTFKKLCTYSDGNKERVRLEVKGPMIARAVLKNHPIRWVETNRALLMELELTERDKLRWPDDDSAQDSRTPAKTRQNAEDRVERVFVYDLAWTRAFSTRANPEEPAFSWYDRRTGSKIAGPQTCPLPKPPK